MKMAQAVPSEESQITIKWRFNQWGWNVEVDGVPCFVPHSPYAMEGIADYVNYLYNPSHGETSRIQ